MIPTAAISSSIEVAANPFSSTADSAASRSCSNALLCVSLIFFYYALLSYGEYLTESDTAPPQLAIWVPNVIFALAAVPLYRRGEHGPV